MKTVVIKQNDPTYHQNDIKQVRKLKDIHQGITDMCLLIFKSYSNLQKMENKWKTISFSDPLSNLSQDLKNFIN